MRMCADEGVLDSKTRVNSLSKRLKAIYGKYQKRETPINSPTTSNCIENHCKFGYIKSRIGAKNELVNLEMNAQNIHKSTRFLI